MDIDMDMDMDMNVSLKFCNYFPNSPLDVNNVTRKKHSVPQQRQQKTGGVALLVPSTTSDPEK